MNNLFDKMMNQIKGHERTHIRVRINNKIVLIKQLYEQLFIDLDSEALISMQEDNDTIEIKITADSIMSCDAVNAFNYLVGIANYTEMDIDNNKIVIYLWFRCWKWVKKQK